MSSEDPVPEAPVDSSVERQVAQMRGSGLGASALRAVGTWIVVALATGFVCAVSEWRAEAATVIFLALAAWDLLPGSSRFPRGGLALASLTSLLFVVAMWHDQLDHALVVSTWGCGTGRAMMMVALPPFAAIVGVAAFIVVQALAKWAPRALPPLAKLIALVAAALALVLGPLAIARVATRPSTEGYVERLPVVTRLAPPVRERMACETTVPQNTRGEGYIEPFTCTDRVSMGGATVIRRLRSDESAPTYTIAIRPSDSPVESPAAPLELSDRSFRADEGVTIRRDEANDFFVVEGEHDGSTVAFGPRTGEPLSLDEHTLVPVDILAHDVSRSTAPAPVVAVFAAVALLFVLSASLVILRKRRTARPWLLAKEGIVDEKGFLEVEGDDGLKTVRVSARPGKVIVLGRSQGAAYRETGAVELMATSHEEIRDGLRTFELRLASALAIALPFALAPVVSAMLLRFLF